MSFVVGFGNSLAQGSEELWRSRNSCLSGSDFWRFSGLKCQRIMAFPKFMSFCIQNCSKFHLVGELSCRGCELEIECQISYPSVTGKVQNLWKNILIFGQFWRASSMHCPNLNLLHAEGRAESALVLSFYVRS